MGQKVCPTGFRLGITENWKSRWYADKNYAALLENDLKLRSYIEKKLKDASVSKVDIERTGENVRITIKTARPGVIIGKKGADIDVLRKELQKIAEGKVSVDVVEVRRPEIDANLVAQTICSQLEGRVAFRRAMRKAVQSARNSGAEGIRIQCSGRLGGAEMSRREWYREGRVPLQTLRAKIDYGFCTANTQMGAIGVQVWIYHGDVMPGQKYSDPTLEGPGRNNRGRNGGRRGNENRRQK